MFENKKTSCGIYYSRYIASWANVGRGFGPVYYRDEFFKWLIEVGCTENEAYEIVELANCGKVELEDSARLFYRDEHVLYSKLL